ncbi:sigma-70 family RNA polymerase sigma factor [Saccharibacillus kuerlensis]|uniref:Uncharacterized protein n=1 Tax=Saccharibacillus kuerlensis TaxID=459527 RepID=A0ABQ2L7M3_9BACL|nr:sigma-70 family RNA polymerase sigma factor [Saccharibacillus kuerlensis]GGO05949.1 hypothetical protein GCM10010969_32830 [Saccharibacillus kuerlensis]
MNPFELEAAVKAAADGDASAFAQLIEAERTQMLRVAGYYVRNHIDAEDAVQEAICRAFTALPTLREPKYFRTWLTRIVINTSMSLLERSRKTIPTGGAEAEYLTASHKDTDGTLDLLQAVSALPPKVRRVILLKYMHDLRLKDIAELLELPLGTVKTYQNKGLNLLRTYYREEIEERRRAVEPIAADSAAWEGKDMESELSEMLHRSRERAKTLFENQSAVASAELKPFIEDVFRHGDQVRELLFIWTKPGTEIGISVTLSPDGDLIDYSVDMELYTEQEKCLHLPPEELFAIGERFVRDHYPDAPDQFSALEIEDRGDRVFFSCSQYASGMPLPRSGFWIDLHRSGFVTAFKYFGSKPEPVMPDHILTPEELLEEVAKDLSMKLYFMRLHESVHSQGDDRLHLVYMPQPYLINRPAVPESGESKKNAQAKDDYDPCAGANEPILEVLRRNEPGVPADPETLLESLGISEAEYEVLREVDMGSERGVVYRRREAVPAAEAVDSTDPYTLYRYMQARNEETVKVRFDRDSGRISSFIDFREETGILQLDDRACLEIALNLLHTADPFVFPHLRLNLEEEEDKETEQPSRQNAGFNFSVCKDSVPGFSHHVSVSVNRTTGRINHYMSADLGMEELEKLSLVPSLPLEEAKRRLIAALEPRLIWELDYSDDRSGDGHYMLRYKLVERESGLSVRMIEAHTGQIVTDNF